MMPKVFESHRDIYGVPDVVVARIIRSEIGGALRRGSPGTGSRPMGNFMSTKSNWEANPWDSKLERMCMEICEVSTKVLKQTSQSHRLELNVGGSRAPLIYFPDLEIEVTESFAQALENRVPFALAALEWGEFVAKPNRTVNICVEVKSDNDRRNEDEEYQHKLKLAKQVYASVGIPFHTIYAGKDLECVKFRDIRDITMDQSKEFDDRDVTFVSDFIQSRRGVPLLGELRTALGGGPKARGQTHAMQVHRHISIDVLSGLGDRARVALMI